MRAHSAADEDTGPTKVPSGGGIHQPLLIATVGLGFTVVLSRVLIQSVTIDEADSYLIWVAPDAPFHWLAAANNHVLNSALMRLFVSLFGASHFSLRAPALLGAIVYLYSAYRICRVITSDALVQWALCLCLVYNPFVLDYLVAARGYGLAMAFLLCAITVAALYSERGLASTPAGNLRMCTWCSVCVGLSFCANFSFAFVDAATMLAIVMLGIRLAPRMDRQAWKVYTAILVASFVPCLLVVTALAAPAALTMPKSQLFFGAHSVGEMFNSIVESSLYEPNPYLANPIVYWAARHIRMSIVWLVAAACCLQCLIVFGRRAKNMALAMWGALGLGGIVVTTVVTSWITFKLFALPLPKDRTAVYFAPIVTLIAGMIAAMPPPCRFATYCRSCLRILLVTMGIYFVVCLRLNYFREWKWDANVRDGYFVVSYYNHRYGVSAVGSNWMYAAALNYYRTTSGRETISEITSDAGRPYPVDRSIYVLHYFFDAGFIEEQRLKIVYHSHLSEMVVAIRPDLEEQEPICNSIR